MSQSRILIGKGQRPVYLLDLYGKLGHPVRTTVSEMGPSLLARILELNDTQEGVLEIAKVISALGVGEALISTLQENAVPLPVERARTCPPRCRMGAITPEERAAVRARSPVGGEYDVRVNRESAYGILSRRKAGAAAVDVPAAEPPVPASGSFTAGGAGEALAAGGALAGALGGLLWGTGRRQGMVEAMAKQAARTVGSQVGRQVLRGVLGGILGGSRRRY